MKQEEVPPVPDAPADASGADANLASEWPRWSFGSHYASQIDIINEKYRAEIDHLIATDPILKADQEALAASIPDGQSKP